MRTLVLISRSAAMSCTSRHTVPSERNTRLPGRRLRRMAGFREGKAAGFVGSAFVDDGHAVAHIELDGLGHMPQPELVAAEVLQDGHGAVVLAGSGAHVGDDGGVFLQGAVRKVEARHIHAGGDQLAERFRGVGLGADGGDDFGFPHSSCPRVHCRRCRRGMGNRSQ